MIVPKDGLLLETRGLVRSFGGLIAVNRVDFKLPSGELRAIIGPNGAGKTTFVNLVCGIIYPSQGRIFFGGRDITNKPAHVRSRMGIGYTFQLTSVFPSLSVFDNVRLPVQARTLKLKYLGFITDNQVESKVENILKRVGLEAYSSKPAKTLSHGDQRKLEIAVALALEPSLLILDEPTQGMATKEVYETIDLIRRISKDKTTLLIEHNMDVVLQLAERITVFDRGNIIAEGTGSEVSRNPKVISSYLGTE